MKRLKWYNYLTINVFWLGLNIRNTALGAIFIPYLVGIFVPEAIKNSALGGMRSAGLVIAMLIQPAAGMLSDRSTSRFGRRRPFILFGALFDCIFLVAIALSQTYFALLIAILLIQFSSNVSHGPLQGLIPDLVPEDQRSHASAVKSIMELLPVVLVGLTIAKLVGAGHLDWAIIVTGVSLLVVTLITMIYVKETPLQEKPDKPFWPPMLRVLGMLIGLLAGGLAGLLGGVVLGGLVGLIASRLMSVPIAWDLSAFPPIIYPTSLPATIVIGVGGAVAMLLAVVVGVWAGCLGTLGRDARSRPAFVWWIANRLMFLAAVTTLQGTVLYFVEYAFNLSPEAAASLTGALTSMIGIFILLTALISGWVSERSSRKRLMILGVRLLYLGLLVLGVVSVSFGITRIWLVLIIFGMQIKMTLVGMIIVGLGGFILLYTPLCGLISEHYGKKGLVGFSGLVAAVGNVLLLSTIWVPNLTIVYIAGTIIGIATGLFMTANWTLGTGLVPAGEAGRYLGISNLAGAGAGIVGAGIGGLVADAINHYHMGRGYFAVFAAYALLFALSAVALIWVRESGNKLPQVNV
jgi:MFS family permease